MSQIQTKEVKRIAAVAKLAITDEEAAKYAPRINHFISLAEKLSEVDTENVERTIRTMNTKNVLREGDESIEGLAIEDIVRNAPDHEDGQIRVPSILE